MIKKIFILSVFAAISFIHNDGIAQQTETVWFPEKFAEYPGGIEELQKFLIKNIIYPKEAREKGIEKMVAVEFIIEKDGSLSNIKLSGSISYDFGFGEEALRVISLMPKWKPGQINGENVRTRYVIPVKFSLDSTLNFDSIAQKQELEKYRYFSTDIIDDSTNIKSSSYTGIERSYSINLPNYSSPDNFSGYWLYFILCENGNYEISTTRNDESFMLHHYISEGNYEVKNDTIVLTDSYNHYQLLYLLDSTSLTPVKTYPFMEERVFKDYYKVCTIEDGNIGEEALVEEIISAFSKANTQRNHFEEGTYKYESFFGTRCELKLHSDKTYEFNFKEEEIYLLPIGNQLVLYLIFSTGTWERKGNILMLWDTTLQHQFYGLIREDGITLLFFRWEDVVFKRE